MDRNGWDLRTPWTCAEGCVFNADGEIVADMTSGLNAHPGYAQAKAEVIVEAVNARHEADAAEAASKDEGMKPPS